MEDTSLQALPTFSLHIMRINSDEEFYSKMHLESLWQLQVTALCQTIPMLRAPDRKIMFKSTHFIFHFWYCYYYCCDSCSVSGKKCGKKTALILNRNLYGREELLCVCFPVIIHCFLSLKAFVNTAVNSIFAFIPNVCAFVTILKPLECIVILINYKMRFAHAEMRSMNGVYDNYVLIIMYKFTAILCWGNFIWLPRRVFLCESVK